MAAWSRKTLKFWEIFAFLEKKRPLSPYAEISKILSGKFSSRHRSTLNVFKCRKICPTGNRWNHALGPYLVNPAKLPRRVNPIFGRSYSLEPTSLHRLNDCCNNMNEWIYLLDIEITISVKQERRGTITACTNYRCLGDQIKLLQEINGCIGGRI